MKISKDNGYHTRKVLLSQKFADELGFHCPFWDAMIALVVHDFNVDGVLEKIVKIILSYVQYINRTTWKKKV